MKAVCPAFLADVLNIQVSISAQRVNHLIDQNFGLVGIFLIDGDRLRRRRRSIRLPEGQPGENNY